MARLISSKLKGKIMLIVLACIASWVFAPLFSLVDLVRARRDKRRLRFTAGFFFVWLIICSGVLVWYHLHEKKIIHNKFDVVFFMTVPSLWYIFRIIIDYETPTITGKEFYNSRRWKVLRYRTLRKYGRKCMLCGAVEGAMHVDHIKPRSKYPHLALDSSNLQVLCAPCNQAKSNVYEDDFR